MKAPHKKEGNIMLKRVEMFLAAVYGEYAHFA